LDVLLRLSLVVTPAAAVAALSVVVDASLPTLEGNYHLRSQVWLALSLVIAAGSVALALVPSRLVALAAGCVAGGVVGNLVSWLGHDETVPNPLVAGALAFTCADVAVFAGALLLTFALARVTIRHRERIDRVIPPRRWERRLRKRLGLGPTDAP
jgi:lipoprotein signal peptidase